MLYRTNARQHFLAGGRVGKINVGFVQLVNFFASHRGNNGYSEIKGDGDGSVLVIKDSYANSFIPYLTADYEKIGVVDYRMNLDKIDAIMEKGGYDRVLFLYSFDAFSEDMYLASRIANA